MSQLTMSKNRISAFDGLKGLALIGVISFYFYEHILPGGYLAVNIFLFFAGFMNFRYFYKKIDNDETIKIWDYYKTRFKRLFFPMLWLILLVSAFILLFQQDFLVNLAGTSITSLLFGNNYYQLASGQSYFIQAIAPNPFSHLWYVSLLAQFILVTPIVVKLVYSYHKQPTTASLMLLVLSIVSAITMAYMYAGNSGPTNVYYRVSTRAFAYTMGGSIAFMTPLSLKQPEITKQQRLVINVIGLLMLVLMTLMMSFMYGTQGFAYYLGMFLFTLITAVFFIIMTHQSSIWHTLIAFKPLAWLGRRSYSYYLWFYPIYIMVPKLDLTNNIDYTYLLLIQFILIAVLSEVSYRIFERHQLDLPIGQDFNYQKMRHQLNVLSQSGKALLSVKVMTFIYIVVAVFGVIGITQSRSAGDEVLELQNLITQNQTALDQTEPTTTENRAINNIEGLDQEVLLYANGLDVTFFGDSTLLSSASQIKAVFPKAIINGEIGRQLYNSYQNLFQLEEQGLLADSVIFMLGANGTFSQTQIDDIVSLLGDQRQIYFVTSNAKRTWTADANRQLRRASDRYGNVQVIDWAEYSVGNDEWLRASDEAHPTTIGAQEMAKFIANEIYRLR
ncbi:acyltransferase [Aerococcaceae bacterium DSM 111176]|nr:acyltransferase [Aerococcaceae bacterium DSM 111176]